MGVGVGVGAVQAGANPSPNPDPDPNPNPNPVTLILTLPHPYPYPNPDPGARGQPAARPMQIRHAAALGPAHDRQQHLQQLAPHQHQGGQVGSGHVLSLCVRQAALELLSLLEAGTGRNRKARRRCIVYLSTFKCRHPGRVYSVALKGFQCSAFPPQT